MRIVWFEVSEPSAYVSDKDPIGGWQDSLERVLKTVPEIELIVAFVSENNSEVRVIDGVTYVPICFSISTIEKIFKQYFDVYVNKMLPVAKKIIDKYEPDLIQVFGTEWPFGLISTLTNIPVVVHIQGAIVPYNNSMYPPGYSLLDCLIHSLTSPKYFFKFIYNSRVSKNWIKWEHKIWKNVIFYMGRTHWDEIIAKSQNPYCTYYHVDEVMRSIFYDDKNRWTLPKSKRIRIFSIGCNTFWKGPDMLLKTAKILKEQQVEFEWIVAGKMPNDIRTIVEKKVGVSFSKCNIRLVGYVYPNDLAQYLCSSTLYVHTSYIDNSPNSICEAQMLGVPVISTNVGGISSLISNGEDGILVPANDPWQMVDAIKKLVGNSDYMNNISIRASIRAKTRHSEENIKKQLISTYIDVLKNRS